MSERKKIVVTGASGFLGKALLEELLERKKYSINCLVGGSDKFKKIYGDGGDCVEKIFAADITDYNSLKETETMGSQQVLVHTAGLAHQFGKVKSEEFWRVNAKGTENVCRLSEKLKIRHLILISSVAVYGNDGSNEVDENHICRPLGPYAESKYEAEKRAIEFCQQKGIGLTILRPATIIGEGDPGNTSRLIEALRKKRFLWVGDGKNRKSLIYKKDVARAIQKVIETENRKGTEMYNLSAEPLAMREIVGEICRNLKISVPRLSLPAGMLKALFTLNDKTASLNLLKKYESMFKKWVSDDIFTGNKFNSSYGFCTRTRTVEAISRQVKFYLKTQ